MRHLRASPFGERFRMEPATRLKGEGTFFGNLPGMKAVSATEPRSKFSHFIPPLLDGDTADHAVPVVIGASQIVGSGFAGGKENILRIAGLHHDLGALAVKHI